MARGGSRDGFFIDEGFPPKRRVSEFDLFPHIFRIHGY